MKSMPASLKNKLRQLQKATVKAKELEAEIVRIIESYRVDPDYLCANKIDDNFTEALTFIVNAEGYPEDNIKEIEEVFLYHVNKNS